ncbi:MAG TPA: MaoC/PaaZ C-terminal domain-containing protein [Acidimicrobiales bacterium]|jgi:acyl dehydratase|nr:MaoC/PaaZ C-terminal domain-containing protein [Acidimicrobiales bacterium]
MQGYWDDFVVGDQFLSTGRTIVDADIRLFIGATDATHPAHVDAVYASKHPFGRIAAPGALVVGVVDGFVVKSLVPAHLKIAHYGYDRVRFLAPVLVGDTIKIKATVMAKKERNEQFGLVYFHYDVFNQDEKTVAVIEDIQMIERRPPDPAV